MKSNVNLLNLAIFGVAVLMAASAWRSPSPVTALATALPENESCDRNRSIQVSGAAVVNITPDRALIQLGVQSNGNTPDATRNANQQEILRVIKAVRALGVEEKDIATDYYIVYPVYDSYNSLFIKGYRIDNTVSVTLRDVNLVDDVILAALKVGANEVQDVEFYTSELRKYRDQARELAIKAASEKAQALAGAAGAQTGCLLTISENTWAQYYGSWRGGREMALWAQNTIQNAPATQGELALGGDSPVSLGQIAIRAEVNASYSLR